MTRSTSISNAYNDVDRVKNLFTYLSELAKLKTKQINHYTSYREVIQLQPHYYENKYIKIYTRDNESASVEGDPLLKVLFPPTTPRPEIPTILLPYSQPSSAGFLTIDGAKIKSLIDEPEVQLAYAVWDEKIKEWSSIQREEQRARDLFSLLMDIRRQFQRGAEALELVVANVTITSAKAPNVLHPLFIKPVEITYLDEENALQIQDCSDLSSIYVSHLGSIDTLDTTDLNKYEYEVSNSLFHPLNQVLAHSIAERLLHSCTPNSAVFNNYSAVDNADNLDVYGYMDPMFILRTKPSGISSLAEHIRDSITSISDVPAHLQQLIGITHQRQIIEEEPPTLKRRLADAGGEDPEILLSKPANTEQLNIARMIEQNNAVIVQGPPGTGKTHTIANLMGHFLAQGKTVLVTSEKDKALSVLKEKIDPEMQPLCVSLVGNSTADLRRSIEEISSTMNMGVSSRRAWVRQFEEQRNQVIQDINDVRLRLFNTLKDEHEFFSIDGEEFFPIDAAQFVEEHNHLLERYGFQADENAPFPFDSEELSALYRLNIQFDESFRSQASAGVPDPSTLLLPQEYATHLIQSQKDREALNLALESSGVAIVYDSTEYPKGFSYNDTVFELPSAEEGKIEDFSLRLEGIAIEDDWTSSLLLAASDQLARQRWNKVVEAAQHIEEFQLSNVDALSTHTISIEAGLSHDFAINTLDEIKGDLALKGMKLKLKKLSDKEGWARRERVLSSIALNGRTIGSQEDAEIAIIHLKLLCAQDTLRQYWAAFINDLNSSSLPQLDSNRPERTVANYRRQVDELFYWGTDGIEQAIQQAHTLGFPINHLINISQFKYSGEQLIKAFKTLKGPINVMAKATCLIRDIKKHEDVLNVQLDTLRRFPRYADNRLVHGLIIAMERHSVEEYEQYFNELTSIYPRLNDWEAYQNILAHVRNISHKMATEISNKEAPHDKDVPPTDLELAWKASRILSALKRIDSVPYQELQERGSELSKKYRELTSKLASNKAWIALNNRVTGNAYYQQALQSWSTTMKKRGKGTGARAQKYERQARELMKQCQEAVPAWIMNINQAASMFDPSISRFDVVIIDEASQSDVTALVMAFLGKKVVVVGDDEQVSPLAVGVDDRRIEMLEAQYLKDSVENTSLYNLRDSLYDIAKTTFNQLMLREHFRCVPQIIGFSNQLSYNGAIKPLREKNDTNLLPATVSYHVDGIREGKTNQEEAETIASLIRACIDDPAYDGKTFGVISMLGNDQIATLQIAIDKALSRHELEERKILVGNSPDFQGDERDVIFLSLVDSNEGEGPLRFTRDGSNESIKKRYNVAASRAKDQLWVVHSLNASDDLKPGDIRRELIEYAKNPESLEARHTEIHSKSDSPFEEEVARALVSQGLNIEQQYEVGAYRIDMALFTTDKKIAIECDGERWHSGVEKISEDLERQTILERLGWTFIRIRGSEYYRDKPKTINRVINQLETMGVFASSVIRPDVSTANEKSELLERIIKSSKRYRETGKTGPSKAEKAAARNFALNNSFANQSNATSTSQPTAASEAKKSADVDLPVQEGLTVDAFTNSESIPDKYAYLDQIDEDTRSFNEYFNSIYTDLDKSYCASNRPETSKNSVVNKKSVAKTDTSIPVKPTTPSKNTSPTVSQKEKPTITPGQEDWVIAELKKNYLKYVDQRSKKGCLWVKGGRELGALMCRLKKEGAVFKLKEKGCRAFQGAAAWHLDNYPERIIETDASITIPGAELLKFGTMVFHKSFGAGKITKFDQQMGRLTAFIGGKERTFQYPEVFSSGLLIIKNF